MSFLIKYLLEKTFYPLVSSVNNGAPASSQGPKIYNACCLRIFQFTMGCFCLCTNNAKQESNSLVNKLGPWTKRCILEKSSYTLCFFDHQKTCDIIVGLCTGLLLHDTHCLCAITSQSGRSWKGCSFPQASNRIVSMIFSFYNFITWNITLSVEV